MLALDLATRLGFAHGDPGARPVSGSVRIEGAAGGFFLNYQRWLGGALDRLQPEIIVQEAPILTGKHTSLGTAERLMGMACITVMECARRNIPRIARVQPSQVKKFLVDNGAAKKQAMIDRCRQLGFEPADDNEADAIAVFLWAEATFFRDKIARSAGPLFFGGAAA
ncbi:MAG TPA: hypothetical protein VFA12_20505 [Stellaceae bacterium]|nr:hypothetical protein [Stellaceae bacterium]